MSLPNAAPPLRHWLIGLALSLALAWAAGAFFLDTLQPLVFDPQIRRFVAAPGVSRTRSEGWASSGVGEHGIRGLPGGRLPAGPKVVFWGDSFVEGVQVDDADRMAQVFTSLSRDAGLALTGVGIGHGGDTLIDSIFRVTDYAPVLHPVALHVFVLGRMSDVLPDAPQTCRAAFFTGPPARLEQRICPPSQRALRLIPWLASLELQGAFSAYRRALGLDLRLAPGPVAAAGPDYPPPTPDGHEAAWDFLNAEILRATGGHALLVYAPSLPRLLEGKVSADDAAARYVAAYARSCAKSGIPFLNLGPALAASIRATGRLPHGFFNSPPGFGHLNEDGHRVAAQAVITYIQEHRDALLAP
jgi:hypothetical protein